MGASAVIYGATTTSARTSLSEVDVIMTATSATVPSESLADRELLTGTSRPGGPGALRLKMDYVPPWVPQTVRALEEIQLLPRNWDSYGSSPTDPATVREAVRLLSTVMAPSTPPPFVVPLPDGGVQLEWHAGPIDLEIEVSPNGRREILYSDSRRRHEEAFELTRGRLSDIERVLMDIERIATQSR
jgi:hypothetical protein